MAQVLLVQGDPELGELLGHVLRRAGYAVAQAGDAAAGLRLLVGTTIDLVLVGPSLPDLPVEAYCRRARARTPAPIVALVEPATAPTRTRARGEAADAYLSLSLPMQALLSQLGTLLMPPARALTAQRPPPHRNANPTRGQPPIVTVAPQGGPAHAGARDAGAT